jgi:tetratricopeptide (TPR) repeat protein
MKKASLLLCCCCLYILVAAQSSIIEDSLKTSLRKARSVPDRMQCMFDLASFYVNLNNALSEQYGEAIIALADSSRRRDWMVTAYLYNAERCYGNRQLQQLTLKGIQYAQEALRIAIDNHLDEYTAWSYLCLAKGSRISSESDKALNYNNLALSVATNIDNDSLKVLLYNSLGETYLYRNQKLLAFRQFLDAMNLAEQTKNYDLLVACYSSMSDFYSSLENYEKAKDYLFKQEELQRREHRSFDLLQTWNNIGSLYSYAKQPELGLKYYEKSIALADSLHSEVSKIDPYIGIVNLYVNNNRFQEGRDYFFSHKMLRDFFLKAGIQCFMDEASGALYTTTGQLDSAYYYLKRSAADIESKANRQTKYWYYYWWARYYRLKNLNDSAIIYTQKSKELGEQIGSLKLMKEAVANLDTLYRLKGDYKSAYVYSTLFHDYKDSLTTLSREKDMMSIEIDNENRRKEREAKLEEERIRRNHNLQYMAITVAIACIFILLGAAGVFRVSRSFIDALGFFAFIFLFEFIILIADTKIHDLTHGEPWKVLAIKIALIAVLLPLHHKLEEKVIHYLTTKELLHLKGRRIWGKWFKKKDMDVPMGNM